MSHEFNENERRQEIIKKLTYELPVLRARIGASQAEIADRLGISRQTYCSIENGKKDMSWTTCVALFAVFPSNVETREMLKKIDGLKDAAVQELEI